MFQKKENILQSYASSSLNNPYASDVFHDKTDNHDFFLLIRDKNYEQAYQLGQKILKMNPNNIVILNFCKFIEKNLSNLKQMVYQEQQYETDSEDQQQSEDDQSDDQQSQIQSKSSNNSTISKSLSQNSQVSNTSSKKSKQSKTNTTSKCLNKIHHWNHKCKNQNCPNKKK